MGTKRQLAFPLSCRAAGGAELGFWGAVWDTCFLEKEMSEWNNSWGHSPGHPLGEPRRWIIYIR